MFTKIFVSIISLCTSRIDPNKNKFRLKLWFSKLDMTGEYHIHGKILMMPLVGHGNCSGNFSKLIILYILYEIFF